jgi:hypothetical protein
MEYIGVRPLVSFSKLLKRWSGGRGSNPRRPAWENERRLKMQNLASMASIECDRSHPVFNDLLHCRVKGAKAEQRISSRSRFRQGLSGHFTLLPCEYERHVRQLPLEGLTDGWLDWAEMTSRTTEESGPLLPQILTKSSGNAPLDWRPCSSTLRKVRLNEPANAGDASRATIWQGNCHVEGQLFYSNITRAQNTIPIQYPISNCPAKPTGSFKRLYRKRARTPCSPTVLRGCASDKALTFFRPYPYHGSYWRAISPAGYRCQSILQSGRDGPQISRWRGRPESSAESPASWAAL